jgi:GMP synthase-like glutamine amidotransferase
MSTRAAEPSSAELHSRHVKYVPGSKNRIKWWRKCIATFAFSPSDSFQPEVWSSHCKHPVDSTSKASGTPGRNAAQITWPPLSRIRERHVTPAVSGAVEGRMATSVPQLPPGVPNCHGATMRDPASVLALNPDAGITVLLLQHQVDVGPGNLVTWLDEQGIPWELVDFSADPLPPVAPWRAVVVLGSEESAYDPQVRWLAAEKAFLSQVMVTGTPVLGLCFGGQLVAELLGGCVMKAEFGEIGWVEVDAVPGNDGAPGAAYAAAGTWFAYHYDRFAPPPGSTVLAWSKTCVHAFRQGPHLGVQFHPEVTARHIEAWTSKLLRRGRLSPDEVHRTLDATTRLAPAAQDAAFRLYEAFFGTGPGRRDVENTGG